jgi:hypothetical protein
MLHIYTRHAADCGHTDDTQWRRCRCPKWLRGVLPNGQAIRESAGTRSWEQAERNARKKEAEADPTRADQAQPRRATVKDPFACSSKTKRLVVWSIPPARSREPFERQFLPFCEARKFVHIDQIVPVDLTEFRSTWNNGDRSAAVVAIRPSWSFPSDTRAEEVTHALGDAYDIYGQLVEYLRMNAIVPPASQGRPLANPDKVN